LTKSADLIYILCGIVDSPIYNTRACKKLKTDTLTS